MSTTADRLKEAMRIMNMKQSEIVEKTGISKGALSSYISGKYVPKQTNTYLIAKALDVDVSWLMGNDVPIEPHRTKGGMSNYEIASLINTLRNDSRMQSVLKGYDSLSESKKETVSNLISALTEKE